MRFNSFCTNEGCSVTANQTKHLCLRDVGVGSRNPTETGYIKLRSLDPVSFRFWPNGTSCDGNVSYEWNATTEAQSAMIVAGQCGMVYLDDPEMPNGPPEVKYIQITNGCPTSTNTTKMSQTASTTKTSQTTSASMTKMSPPAGLCFFIAGLFGLIIWHFPEAFSAPACVF